MRATLAAVCAFTLLATAYLTASLVVLAPPRADHQRWGLVAAGIVAQGVLTLIALRPGSPQALRHAMAAGAAAVAALGAWWVYSTMSGAHFEGYAQVLGCAMVVQGALTLALSGRASARRTTSD